MKLKSPLTIEQLLDYTATITALLLPVILITGVWIGFEEIKEILFTDVILLIASIVFYKSLYNDK